MSAMDVSAVEAPTIRRRQIMQAITTVGLDIAKSVFQVHGVDADGNVILRRQLKRRYGVAVLPEVIAVSGWYRSLRYITLLVS
jgi:hypothetical protein